MAVLCYRYISTITLADRNKLLRYFSTLFENIRSLVYGCIFLFIATKQEHFMLVRANGYTWSIVTFKRDIKQRQLIANEFLFLLNYIFSCGVFFFLAYFFAHANIHFPFHKLCGAYFAIKTTMNHDFPNAVSSGFMINQFVNI